MLLTCRNRNISERPISCGYDPQIKRDGAKPPPLGPVPRSVVILYAHTTGTEITIHGTPVLWLVVYGGS